jgi:hypothetical protein
MLMPAGCHARRNGTARIDADTLQCHGACRCAAHETQSAPGNAKLLGIYDGAQLVDCSIQLPVTVDNNCAFDA